MTLFVPLWFISFSYALKALSILGHSGAYLPHFPFMGSSNGTNKTLPPSLNSSKECKATCINGSSLGSRIYSFLFTLLGSHGRLLYQQNHVCLNFSLVLGNGGKSHFLDQNFVQPSPIFPFLFLIVMKRGHFNFLLQQLP